MRSHRTKWMVTPALAVMRPARGNFWPLRDKMEITGGLNGNNTEHDEEHKRC